METSGETSLKPDHVIIWLDRHIGVKTNNRTSKIDLATNVNLDYVPSTERSLDIDNLIGCADGTTHIDQKLDALLQTTLHMFTDKKDCLRSIDNYLVEKKRVFFISSGSLGATIVPDIAELLSGYIYIFCAQMVEQEWAYDYVTDLIMFDHETDLFARLLRDIAKYYILKSENCTDQAVSIEYLRWAHRMARRANKLDDDDVKFIKTIEQRLERLHPPRSDDNDDDCPMSQDIHED